MGNQDEYLRNFTVLLTEKGVVPLTDPLQIAVYNELCSGSKRPSDIAASLGISFWQLPQDTMGISRRYSLLITIVLYLIVQGFSGRIWFRKDREVFIRDIRCGYHSPLEYFSGVVLLDGVFIRFLPSILFVETLRNREL